MTKVKHTMTAAEKVQQARTDLMSTQPFFGYLCLKLEIIEDRTCPTGWTDGVYLAYNPDFIDTLDVYETTTFLAHETTHCAGGDQWRRGDRDPDVWNDAADYVRNLQLTDAKFKPIEGWYCKEKYRGMTVEKVFTILWKKQEEEEKEEKEEKEQPSGNGAQKPQSKKAQGKPDAGAKAAENGEGKPEQGTQAGDGSGKPAKAPNPCGEVRDAPQTDGEDGKPAAMTQSEWTLAATRALEAARAAGKSGAELEEFVGQLKDSDREWREELQKFVQMSAHEDYSYLRPNRKYVAAGIVMPTLYSEQMPPLVFVSDVSGSVSQEEFKACASAVVAAIDQCQPEAAHLIQFDAPVNSDPFSAIREYKVLEKGDDIEEVVRRGAGGTMFRPVFDFVEKEEINPACMIFLSDMEPCDEWPEEPDYPVLWVSTNKKKAPWGDTIHILDGGDWK